MTTFSISLGQDLIFHGGDPGDQVVVHSHGNGNALGNKLVQEGNNTVTPETLSQFIAFITGIGPLERGHTYIGHALFDPDNGDQPAEFIVTDTQSGKIGAIELVGGGATGAGSLITDHVLTLG